MCGDSKVVGETLPERMEALHEGNSYNGVTQIFSLGWNVILRFIKKIKYIMMRHWAFCSVVVLPTFLVAVYVCGIASPQYVSETHFLVRGKSSFGPSMGGLSSLLESSHGGSQDTYAVQDYMMSRDAAKLLVQDAGLRGIFNRPYADFLAKFPSILTRRDFESFYKFYKSHVKAQIDEETGISHLTVRSFSPKDSQYVAQKLLASGEELVNEMNDRQRYNTLHVAEEELNKTFKELHDTEMELAVYRHKNEIIDPLKQATPMVGATISLETALGMMEAEKDQLNRVVPQSPLSQVYAQRIASIQARIKQAQEHITGQSASSPSLVPKLLGYEELTVRTTIIGKKLVAETSALEVAKSQADRQMLYVTVVAKPSLPDYAEYPKRIIFLLIAFSTALGVYVTGKLLVAGAREHALQ